MNEWSHSRLRCYMSCPAQFRMRYIDELPAAPVEGFALGKTLHEAIEEYSRWCFEHGRARDFDRMGAIAGRFDDDAIRAALRQFAEGRPFDWSRAIGDSDGVERAFEVELPGEYGLLRGRVDFVEWNEADSALWVWDRKSHYKAPRQQETCDRQLQLYAWAMLSEYPADRVVCFMDYWRAGEIHQWELEPPLSVDWVLALVDRIRAETKWEATPGRHCEYCGHRSDCGLATSTERGPEWLAWAEAEIKAVRAQVRERITEHGPIPCGNGIYDLVESASNRHTVPRENMGELVRRLTSAGVDHGKYLSAKHDRLGGLVDQDGNPFADETEDGVVLDIADLVTPLKPTRRLQWQSLQDAVAPVVESSKPQATPKTPEEKPAPEGLPPLDPGDPFVQAEERRNRGIAPTPPDYDEDLSLAL